MDLPTFQDIFRVARDEALVRNRALALEEAERKGSDLNILLAASAAVGDEVIGQLARAYGTCFLDTAKKQELDRLVFDRYGLIRKQASPSYGLVEFTTTTAAAAGFTITDGTLLGTPDGSQYIVVGNTAYAFGEVGPVQCSVRSTLAGATQKAKPGTITSILSQITGAPADLAVTNANATFAGEDAEPDSALAERARGFFVNARRGTLLAIQNAILALPGIQTCTLLENLDQLGRPIGAVEAVVSDSFTEQFISGAPAAYATQAAAITSNINSILDEARAAGIYVNVTIAAIVLQTFQLALAYRTGYTQSTVQAQVKATIVAFVNALSPGRTLLVNDLKQKISEVPGVFYTGNELVEPSGNVVPQQGQVLRTALQFITVL